MSESANRKYRHLKAELVRRGTTLRRWSQQNGVAVGTVYLSARGHRHGPVAVKIRRDLQRFITT